MYSYRCVVIVKFTVQGLGVNHGFSSQSFTVIGLVLSQASACELMLEEVTPSQFSPLSLSATLRHHSALTHSHTSLTLPTTVTVNIAVQENTAVELPLPTAAGSTYCTVCTEHTNRCTFTDWL
jgi:hypothetical protein